MKNKDGLKWAFESDGDIGRKTFYLVASDENHRYRIDCENKKEAFRLRSVLNENSEPLFYLHTREGTKLFIRDGITPFSMTEVNSI